MSRALRALGTATEIGLTAADMAAPIGLAISAAQGTLIHPNNPYAGTSWHRHQEEQQGYSPFADAETIQRNDEKEYQRNMAEYNRQLQINKAKTAEMNDTVRGAYNREVYRRAHAMQSQAPQQIRAGYQAGVS